ncbi:glutamate-rich protein 3 [Stigmatopora argus]
MSQINPGRISAYNALTDKHLIGYFSSTSIRKHLRRAGLITQSGRIVPDKEYKRKVLRKSQQKDARESRAQGVFAKVLEMEHLHQTRVKKQLEEFARKERAYKVVRASRLEGELPVTWPRPPEGPRKQHSGPVEQRYGSSESPCSSRPNTAPGTIQRPVRLKPINGAHKRPPCHCTVRPKPRPGDEKKRTERWRPLQVEPGRGGATTREPPLGVSPYLRPLFGNFATPSPPAAKRKGGGSGGTPGHGGRRRLRAATCSAALGAKEERPLRTCAPRSGACVTMVYFGKSVHLSREWEDPGDEVKVFQQHCGGENLCVYEGKLRQGESFRFVSRRHRGFPFSLTFFLNGLQVERLSSCCEFKHRRGPRLGGRHGHFGFSAVERASPCYKCIIATGLDKKPAPPAEKFRDGRWKETTSAGQSGREGASPTPRLDERRDDYEEDFEGDEEGAGEKKAPPPAEGTPTRNKGGISSDSEVDDPRPRSSSSSGQESDIKSLKDSKADEEAEEPEEVIQEESVDQKVQVANPQETTGAESSTDGDVSDSGEKERRRRDAAGEKSESEEIQEWFESEDPERAKSVQEKLAEAIVESRCSSERELSEEEEGASTNGVQEDRKDEACLLESKLEATSSRPKELVEEPQDDPDDKKDVIKAVEREELKEPEDGDDLETKIKEEPEENAPTISADNIVADGDTRSDLDFTPEARRDGLEGASPKADDGKDQVDEASGDMEGTDKGDYVANREEEETTLDEKPSEAKGAEEDTTGDGNKTHEMSQTEEETKPKAGLEDKIESDNGEVLEAHEKKAVDITGANKEDGEIGQVEASREGTDEDGERQTVTEGKMEDGKDLADTDQEKIKSTEVEMDNATTEDKQEMVKDENEEEKNLTSEIQEREDLDQVTNGKGEKDGGMDKDGDNAGGEEIKRASEEKTLEREAVEESQEKTKNGDEDMESDHAETKERDRVGGATIDGAETSQEETKNMDNDTEEGKERSKSPEEHLQDQGENMALTDEKLETKIPMMENGPTNEVDAINGETSPQAGSDTREDEDADEKPEQNGSQVSLEDKPLEVTIEKPEELAREHGEEKADQKAENLETEDQNGTQDHLDEKPKESFQIEADPAFESLEKPEKEPKEKAEESSKLLEENVVAKNPSEYSMEGEPLASQSQIQSNTHQFPHGESPETLARSSSAELVTNWLTMHQASKFFETFVEPLEDLKESDAGAASDDKQCPLKETSLKTPPSQDEDTGLDVKPLDPNSENQPHAPMKKATNGY